MRAEFHEAGRPPSFISSMQLVPHPVPSCSPPLPGCYKLNIDASHVVVNAGLVGLGLMIRNEAGCVRLVASLNPQLAKAIAILHGICLAIDSGMPHN
ncbi:hypothetical protein ACOSQ4_023731 [Xanthoceras sorbifolium]